MLNLREIEDRLDLAENQAEREAFEAVLRREPRKADPARGLSEADDDGHIRSSGAVLEEQQR